jgi:hypothetical protein
MWRNKKEGDELPDCCPNYHKIDNCFYAAFDRTKNCLTRTLKVYGSLYFFSYLIRGSLWFFLIINYK